MAALNFPSNPSINDTYTGNGRIWVYNGTSWISGVQPVTIGYLIPGVGIITQTVYK
jgi:hypothetical protein